MSEFANVLERVGNIVLSNVIIDIDTERGKKHMLNVSLLVKSLTRNILSLSNAKLQLGSVELKIIDKFLNDLANSVDLFCNFLDYDGDGVVELMQNTHGQIEYGDDIEKMLADIKGVTSSFKNHGNIQTTIIAIVSSIVLYFTNENIKQTRNDFLEFKTSCEETHKSMLEIKNVNLLDSLKANSEDLIRFIILMCVLIVPIVELVNKKLVLISTSDLESASVSQEEIRVAVYIMYGTDLEFILSTVDNLVTVFAKSVKPKEIGQKIKDFFGRFKCSCSCCTKSKTD